MLRLSPIVITLLTLTSVAAAAIDNWPQFRGAPSDGPAERDMLPDRCSATENVV